MKTLLQVAATILLSATTPGSSHAQVAMAGPQGPVAPVTILNRDASGAVMPATVFFRGQTATVQARNSAGLRIGKDKLVLTALVDTGGYSTAVQQTYQAYLLTEVPLRLGTSATSPVLAPGAYGIGFIAPHRVTVMDVGGNEIASADTATDTALTRPNPLQILPGTQDRSFRLYMGRTYVTLLPLGAK